MTYTGDVEVGGPAESQTIGDLAVTKFAVGDLANNVYLLECTMTGERAIIDAADDADRIQRELNGAPVARTITTHWHPDHWQALAQIVEATGAETVAGAVDAPHIEVPTSHPVETGARVRVGSCELEVIEVTGHTEGSIVLVYDDPDGATHLFTGDSLFPGGVGKTWSAEDFQTLINEIETKIFARFEDTTRFYPGHGSDSTLGAERPHLAEWRERGW